MNLFFALRQNFRGRARGAGRWLVLVSALAFSTAGTFTKGVTTDAWSVIFWRGLFAAGCTILFIGCRGGLGREFLRMGKPGLLAATVSASGSAAFISAFKLTSVANVSLIYASAPFAAALVAWLWMRERPAVRIVLASLAAFAGVTIIVGASLTGLHLKGDLLALWMTLMLALVMAIYRRYPETPGAGPMALSAILLLPAALIFGEPLSAPLAEIPIMALFGLVFALAAVTLVVGARYLPAAETALISSLEAPFAILLAWIILAEAPGIYTLVGGAIILAAVFCAQGFTAKSGTNHG